jgi:tritrans,polycis-undecaprenyl-diphosphate synthase [geranylgeranyl-diphosphate specific]
MKMVNPLHVGIILDGNRRFAKKIGEKPWEGHRIGVERVKELIFQWAPELKIKELTLYCFSMQNFNRSNLEIKFLMKIFEKVFQDINNRIKKENIKINFIGRTHLFPDKIRKLVSSLTESTKDNDKLIVNFAFGYGGKEEIIDGIKKLLVDIQKGIIKIDEVDTNIFTKYLYLQSKPEMIIRTGGAIRTSNFLIWQSSYSEWFFLEKFWPEFEKQDLIECIESFKSRERRYGK